MLLIHGARSVLRAATTALRSGKKIVEDAASFADGYRVQLVLDALRESNERRCWVDIGG